ncbi:spermidine/putrescine ABC transporter substrate-binding protein [Candidatus Saccharibacteria bacterium]|nr:spermidine/putrescine ABC transporter substrate-binding protein [Candidatus Saccharibacteria bacterium]MBR6122110.1 spermidine/putrescine ABC transporter substrate-binding protein [Candidatus Saccharibacteria bacterium]
MKLLEKLKTPLLSLTAIGLVIIIVALATRPRATEPETANTLNVLNWTSYIPSEIIKDFEAESGIKVNYGTYSSNEELLAKLVSSSDGTYDVVFPSDYMVDLLISKDLLAPLDHSKLPNEANLNPLFLNQPYDTANKYSLPFLLATTVFLYDSTKLDRLTSYKDLQDPSLVNNLVLLDDQRIIIGAMLQATGHDMNDAHADHLQDSLDFFNQIKPNIKAFDSDSPKTFFITKEVDAGLVWNAEATLAVEENPDLKISYPAEGFALSMDNYVILKGSRHQDAAHAFINYLLRNDVSQKIVDEYPYLSPNKSVASLPDAELTQILENGSYVKNVGADIKAFDKLWAKYK